MSSHPPRSGPAPAMFRPHGETGIANTLRLTSPPLLLLGRSSPISLSLTSLATEFDAFFIRPLLSLSRRPAPLRPFARPGHFQKRTSRETHGQGRAAYHGTADHRDPTSCELRRNHRQREPEPT